MKTTYIAMAMLALASGSAFAALPYSELYKLSGQENTFELVIKANSTKVVGADADTKVNIQSVTVDEAYVAANANMGEVVFSIGEYTNNGTLAAHYVNVTPSASYYDDSVGSYVDAVGATLFTNNGVIDLRWTEEDEFWGTTEERVGSLYVSAGASFTNNGSIYASTIVRGDSTLTAADGCTFNDELWVGIGDSAGSFVVEGDIAVNGSMLCYAGEIVFTEGSSIDMMNNSISGLENVSLVYQVEYSVDELNPITVSDIFVNSKIADTTVITVKGSDGTSYETTVGSLTVPEPSTAALSLLALAGLAARRRR